MALGVNESTLFYITVTIKLSSEVLNPAVDTAAWLTSFAISNQ